MAFIVQDDTGTVTDANAYVEVADFRSYWTDRGVDTASLDDDTVQGRIIEATQYIDFRYQYSGAPLDGRDQTTAFPRSSLYDKYCNEVDGVPREVKQACYEYAYAAGTASLNQTIDASEKSVIKEVDQVDVLNTEREYNGSKSSDTNWNVYQVADQVLLNSGFVVYQWGLGRA